MLTKSAQRVKQWIIERLEANDRIVVKEITSQAFKSSPDEFKHVSTCPEAKVRAGHFIFM